MKALNKETAKKTVRPERIIQFGEGNFLRAFVDWIIYNMNEKADFNSSVVVVQPIEKGMIDMLNAQDCQVTLSKETFMLPEPFLVMATQNPIEQEGTYPLPEAQVDRFMLKVIIDYPKLEEEKKIIRQNITGEKIEVRPILKATDIMEARKVVRQVYLDEKIEQYIADIVFATRFPEKYDLKELKDMIGFGGSPRASINLALAARSYAFIKRRGYVIPEDVRAVAHDVLRHRIGLTYEAEAMNMSSDEIVSKILNKVEVP
jgi:MoxR-like ATPase